MIHVWYAKRSDLEFGPWSVQELKAAAASGVLRPDDLVRTAGKDKWVRAGDVKGLVFGTIPVQLETIQEPNSSQPTSPERQQPPPLPAKSKSGPPPLPTLTRTPKRFPVNAPKPVMLVGVCILGLFLACGLGVLVTEGRKSSTTTDRTGGPTATDPGDIALCDLKGLYKGMSREKFQEAIITLGPPTFTGSHPFSYIHIYNIAAWKRKNGLYDYIWWHEVAAPGEVVRIERIEQAYSQTLGQVDNVWKMLTR